MGTPPNKTAKNFSSNPSKYAARVNRERLEGFRDGKSLPKLLHISPTDKCGLRCFFCSSDKREGDTMSLSYILESVDKLLALGEREGIPGLESIELTGGGDPMEFPEISQLIQELVDRDLAVGMISNCENFTKKVTPEASQLLTWLRCSINWKPKQGRPMDEWPFVLPDIPPPNSFGRPDTVGFSVVMTAGLVPDHKTKEPRWLETPREHFDLAAQTVLQNEGKYFRVVTNCLGQHEDIDRAIAKFRRWVDELNVGREEPLGYWQHKYPVSPKVPCHTGYFRPFANSDGWIYPCSSCTLSEEQFPKSLRVCRLGDLAGFYENQWLKYEQVGRVQPIVQDPSKASGCVNCTFTHNVELLDRVANEADFLDELPIVEHVEHPEFL